MHTIVGGGRYITKLKFCNTCIIYRPERTFHCNFCGNCVHYFDHHCTWLGTCVGGRNYKQFVAYIFLVTLLQVYCLGLVVTHWLLIATDSHDKIGFWEGVKVAIINYPAIVVVLLVSILIVSFTLNLFMQHMMLVCHSLSTYEYLKGHYRDALFNPHRKSCGTSMANLLCRKRPQKMYDLTEFMSR